MLHALLLQSIRFLCVLVGVCVFVLLDCLLRIQACLGVLLVQHLNLLLPLRGLVLFEIPSLVVSLPDHHNVRCLLLGLLNLLPRLHSRIQSRSSTSKHGESSRCSIKPRLVQARTPSPRDLIVRI